MTFVRRLVPALVLAALVGGCASAPGSDAGDPFEPGQRDTRVLLTVENNDFRDATIYAYWNGMKDRIGMVTGKTSDTFEMEWRSEEVRFEVDFVGGGGHFSERVAVYEGDHLNYVIQVR